MQANREATKAMPSLCGIEREISQNERSIFVSPCCIERRRLLQEMCHAICYINAALLAEQGRQHRPMLLSALHRRRQLQRDFTSHLEAYGCAQCRKQITGPDRKTGLRTKLKSQPSLELLR